MAMSLGSFSKPYTELIGVEISVASSDTEVSTDSTTYVKIKEFTITTTESNIAVKLYWEMKRDGGALTVFVKPYVNDVAVGTEIESGSATYGSFTEILTGINNGDKIQLYGKRSAGGSNLKVQNYRLRGIQTYLKPTYVDTT